MEMIVGMKGEVGTTVEREDTAKEVGSGDLLVYATPCMVALMEGAACDAIAEAGGFCILEKRFIDTTMRYGFYDFSLDRWRKTYEYKEEFEKRIGRSLYSLLPGIEECIYR